MTTQGSLNFLILIDAGDNDVHQIRRALLELEPIKIAHCPLGPTDLICYCRVENMDALSVLIDTRVPDLLEDRFNPIQKAETLLIMSQHGEQLTAEKFAEPNGIGAWVFTDQNISHRHLSEKLVDHHPELIASFNVLGSHDCIYYAEAPSLDQLMTVIDEGFRTLRSIGAEGQSIKALSRTDTRLVLM